MFGKKESRTALDKCIRELREKKGWTQREVAEKSYITESAFRSYELGDRTPKREVIDRMAKAFGVRSKSLTAPESKNAHEFCYALLQNEEIFDLRHETGKID